MPSIKTTGTRPIKDPALAEEVKKDMERARRRRDGESHDGESRYGESRDGESQNGEARQQHKAAGNS